MRNKYSGDYRLLETFSEDGRIHTDYEYIGKPFIYAERSDKAEKMRGRVILPALVSIAAWVAAMIPFSYAMRSLWVALPFAAVIIPLAMLAELLFSVRKLGEKAEHRYADRLNNRYPALAVTACFFSAVSLTACVIRLAVRKTAVFGDAVFAVCSILIFACAAAVFRRRALFRMEEADI